MLQCVHIGRAQVVVANYKALVDWTSDTCCHRQMTWPDTKRIYQFIGTVLESKPQRQHQQGCDVVGVHGVHLIHERSDWIGHPLLEKVGHVPGIILAMVHLEDASSTRMTDTSGNSVSELMFQMDFCWLQVRHRSFCCTLQPWDMTQEFLIA